MFDKETRWFIRCDTHHSEPAPTSRWASRWAGPMYALDKDEAAQQARDDGWSIRDDLHRCPDCVREGRTEMAS